MPSLFIYRDNSNIFIGAQAAAVEREGETARSRVRFHFRNLLSLVRRGRDIERAITVGSIPPELRGVWNRLENEGIAVALLERGALHGREQGRTSSSRRTCFATRSTIAARQGRPFYSPATGATSPMAQDFAPT